MIVLIGGGDLSKHLSRASLARNLEVTTLTRSESSIQKNVIQISDIETNPFEHKRLLEGATIIYLTTVNTGVRFKTFERYRLQVRAMSSWMIAAHFARAHRFILASSVLAEKFDGASPRSIDDVTSLRYGPAKAIAEQVVSSMACSNTRYDYLRIPRVIFPDAGKGFSFILRFLVRVNFPPGLLILFKNYNFISADKIVDHILKFVSDDVLNEDPVEELLNLGEAYSYIQKLEKF